MADTLEDSATACDAAVVRIHGTGKALALTADCTPRYVAADPYEGGKQAVAEAWRNLVAAGATPIAITDNLNFGNPERPEIMGQIVRAIDGMAEACRALDFPVVSGNVSLYNETSGQGIPPTPVVGAVGLIEAGERRIGFGGLRDGDVLALIGGPGSELGCSLYLREVLGREAGAPPPVDLAVERRNGETVRDLIASGWLTAVHDISDGGLLVAAAEMALASRVGLQIDAPDGDAVARLFGEDQGRYLVAAPIDRSSDLLAAGAVVVGRVAGEALTVRDLFSIPVDELRAAHEGWLPRWLSAV